VKVSDTDSLKSLKDQKAKLKRLLADTMLYNVVLKGFLGKSRRHRMRDLLRHVWQCGIMISRSVPPPFIDCTAINERGGRLVHCPAGDCTTICREGGFYAAGLSTRDIRAHLEEVYGLNVSADLISRVTDAVLAEVSDWQNRAMELMYPIRCRAMDGLKGFPDAINAAFSETTVQAGAPPVQG
jgi:hypothetical protein